MPRNTHNGTNCCYVYWLMGSSATIGVSSAFKGSILASESITLNTGANMTGRALALNAAVTLDNNNIIVPTAIPEPAVLWLLVLGVAGYGVWRRMALWQRRVKP